ncbi:MAG: DNA repair protein RadC [Vallitaleaceae bacterium]|nr:DNA repair protein RadC [Vallitaleaceae bacterium]
MTIKDLPLCEQPYTRLEISGAKMLTNAELLAIIIKTGTKTTRAIDIATNLLNMHQDGLLGLHAVTIEELKTIHGIGRIKAIQIKALTELSIRISSSKKSNRVCVTSPTFVAGLYMEELRHLQQEHFKLVVLDNKNNIIKDHTLSIGTVNATLVNPREVLIYCLQHHCVQYIVLHNHPSGDCTPSTEDVLMTERLKKASELIGITLLDHIIIGNQNFTSLKEQGYIK